MKSRSHRRRVSRTAEASLVEVMFGTVLYLYFSQRSCRWYSALGWTILVAVWFFQCTNVYEIYLVPLSFS